MGVRVSCLREIDSHTVDPKMRNYSMPKELFSHSASRASGLTVGPEHHRVSSSVIYTYNPNIAEIYIFPPTIYVKMRWYRPVAFI